MHVECAPTSVPPDLSSRLRGDHHAPLEGEASTRRLSLSPDIMLASAIAV